MCIRDRPVAAPDQDSKKESEEDLKAKVQNKMVKTKVADEKAIDEDPIPEKTPRLVYGNKDLPDEDAFVLLIFGDGFTKDEQDKFFEEAEKTADYVMAVSYTHLDLSCNTFFRGYESWS